MGSRHGQHCVLEERLDAQQRRGVNGGSGGEVEGRQKGPGVWPMARVLSHKAPPEPRLLVASQSTEWG